MQNRATFCKLRLQEKRYNFTWSLIAEMGHFLQITIARETLPFLKKNYTISPDRKLQNRSTFCKLQSQEKLYNFSWSRIAEMGHFLQITIARKTLPFLKKNYTYSPDRKWQNYDRKKNFTISQEKQYNFFLIANCRNGSLSANYDRNFTWSLIAEMGQFLQITIATETLPFLKKNYTISRDR